MSSEDVEIQYTLTVNTEMTYGDLRKLEGTLMRVMTYIKKFSGSEELNEMITTIQKTIVLIRTLQIAIRALDAASGPIGWVYAGVSLLAVAMATDSLTYDVQRAGS